MRTLWRHVLLQGVERADTVSLREAVVLAAVDDQHRGGPLVHEVDRIVPGDGWGGQSERAALRVGGKDLLFNDLLRAGLPWASSPFVVELRTIASVVERCDDCWKTHEEELVGGVAVVLGAEGLYAR